MKILSSYTIKELQLLNWYKIGPWVIGLWRTLAQSTKGIKKKICSCIVCLGLEPFFLYFFFPKHFYNLHLTKHKKIRESERKTIWLNWIANGVEKADSWFITVKAISFSSSLPSSSLFPLSFSVYRLKFLFLYFLIN